MKEHLSSDSSIMRPASSQLTSAERIAIPTRGHKVLVASLALIILIAIGWGLIGSIPTTLGGNGIIVRERQQVFAVQSAWGGKIAKINVRAGEEVEAGQTLVELERPELEEEIAAARQRLMPLQQDFKRDKARLEAEVSAHNLAASKQLTALSEGRAAMRSLLERLENQSSETDPIPADRQGRRGDPWSRDSVYEQTRAALSDTEIKLARVQAEIVRFRTQATDQLENWERNVRDQSLKLRQLEMQLENSRHVLAPVAGFVGEIREGIGQNVVPQDVLLTVVSGGPGFEMLAFLDPEDAPRARLGMSAHVSPTTVAKGEYGTMRGDVAFVSEAPVSTAQINALLRNIELSQAFTRRGQPYLCRIDLFETPDTRSGFEWWHGNGPPFPITISTLATVDIVVHEQAPITLLLPSLRELFGV